MPKKKIKNLRFELTLKEYALFWEIVGKLGESKKSTAFIQMLEKLNKIL